MNVKNKKVSVLGGGLSGISVSKLLKNKGASVFLSEINDTEMKRKELSLLENENIKYELGSHSNEKILDADIIIISPGISPNIKVIKEAEKRDIPVYGDLEAASWYCRSKIIAVTGTNGKSTTVSLLGELFTTQGIKNVVAGNIGRPFSGIVDSITKEDIVVLEVSSYQLEKIKDFHPYISVLLNVSFDHMDRYTNFNDYVKTKVKITQNQNKNEYCIFNYDDIYIRKYCEYLDKTVLPISMEKTFRNGAYLENSRLIFSKNDKSEELIETSEILLKGNHNVYNCLAAISAAKICNIDNSKITESLKMFRGLEHRFEFIDSVRGVNFINDSKATNVDSVYYALKSLKSNVILLAGGRDKEGDLFKLNNLIRERVKTIILFGEAAARMKKDWEALSPCFIVDNFEDAVKKSWSVSEEGDTILLSPACSSFDMFKNFEVRGETFKELVKRIKLSYELQEC